MTGKRFHIDLVLGSIITVFFGVLSFTGFSFFEGINIALYDAAMGFGVKDTRDPGQIVLIDIDERSQARLGPYPWPRHVLAKTIERIRESGARVVGLNIPFPLKEPNQGLVEIQKLELRAGAHPSVKKDANLHGWLLENLKQLEQDLDNDKKLVDTVQRSGDIILPIQGDFGSSSLSTESVEMTPVLSRNCLTPVNLSDAFFRPFSTERLSLPFAELLLASSGLGHGHLSLFDPGSARTHVPFIVFRGNVFPSFPLRLAIASGNQEPRQVLLKKNEIDLKDYSIPIFNGEMFVRFDRGYESFPRFSLVDILTANKGLPILRGKIVLIGLGDLQGKRLETPLHTPASENTITAHILRGILNNRLIRRPSHMGSVEILAILLLGGIAAHVFSRAGSVARLGWMALLSTIPLATAILMLSLMSVWLKTALMSGCVLTIYLAFSLKQLIRETRPPRNSVETVKMLVPDFQSQDRLDSSAMDTRSGTKNVHLDAESPAPISRIGRYEILGELGKGAMGLVYKALDPRTHRLLAIKTIRFSDEYDEDVLGEIKYRFLREAEIAGRLSHPSIVSIHDAGEDGDLTFMAMEFLEGKDLKEFTIKDTLLPLEKVLEVVALVAEALDFAHRAEIIHRDVKPTNIMILDNGGVKVTDFGIAKAISSSRTKTGVILGTPNYMSPEQIMGQKIDHRSDIFSLGGLFYQLLTGELPFHGDNLSALLYQITQAGHPPVHTHDPRIPRACGQIIDKALAKNPEERFKTAGEMARLIRILASKIDQIKKRKPGTRETALGS